MQCIGRNEPLRLEQRVGKLLLQLSRGRAATSRRWPKTTKRSAHASSYLLRHADIVDGFIPIQARISEQAGKLPRERRQACTGIILSRMRCKSIAAQPGRQRGDHTVFRPRTARRAGYLHCAETAGTIGSEITPEKLWVVREDALNQPVHGAEPYRVHPLQARHPLSRRRTARPYCRIAAWP